MNIKINMDTESLRDFSSFVEVETNQTGRKQFYSLSIKELIEVLSSHSSVAREEIPLISPNTFKVVRLMNGWEVYTEVSKNQWIINYHGHHFKVGFPRLVCKYLVEKRTKEKKEKEDHTSYNVKLERIVAIKDKDKLSLDMLAYQFPYSHVEESGGKVCMGGNSLPPITSLAELETYHTFFLHSPFGADYGQHTTLKRHLAELFSDVFNEKDFDDTVLRPYGSTLGEFFNLDQK